MLQVVGTRGPAGEGVMPFEDAEHQLRQLRRIPEDGLAADACAAVTRRRFGDAKVFIAAATRPQLRDIGIG